MVVVTTGLREFWPEDRPFWLISPICVPRGTDTGVRPVGILPYAWTHENLPEAHHAARNEYDRAMAFLVERLNNLHRVKRGAVYWRVVLGPWLFQHINLLVHHARTLQMALDRFGSVETIGLHDNAFVTPATGLAFIYEAADDLYNLQLYTRLCRVGGVRLLELREPVADDRLAARANPENFAARRHPLTTRLAARGRYEAAKALQALLAPRVNVLCRRSYLPARFERKLIAGSRGRIWSDVNGEFQPASGGAVDRAGRERLRGLPANDTTVGRYLATFLGDDVPRVFVEHYEELTAFARRAYGRYAPKAIVSTASWFTDHAFCHFAGERAEAGTRLAGGQHGGDFGIEAQSQHLAFERMLTDVYLTWGWSDPSDPGCVPTPAARFVEVRERPRPIEGDGILYVGTVALRFPLVARPDFSKYTDLQRRFFGALSPSTRGRVRARLHQSDYGWGNEARLREAFPDLAIERWTVAFNESLRRARLYVVDHISTTFGEALATNTPMVMFWDPVFFAIRDQAQPIFDRARTAGIVHDTPESAAAWVERIYPDVDGWWFARETQCAVSEFRHQFARVTVDPLSAWRTVLMGLAAHN